MLVLYLLIIVVLVLYIVNKIKFKKLHKQYQQTKISLPCLPFIQHCYLFFGNNEDWMTTFKRIARESYNNKHGVISVWLINTLYSVVSDPESAKPVLKYCLDKGILVNISKQLLGNSSIFAPVNIWRPRRKILSRSAAPKHVDQFFEVFVRNSNSMMEELEAVAGKGEFSFWKYYTSFTLNSSCETVYGEDLHLQKNLDHPFFRAFEEYLENIGARVLQLWLHSDFVYNLLPVHKKQMHMKNIVQDFSKNLMEEKVKRKETSITQFRDNLKEEQYKTFFEMFIEYSGGDEGYTDIELLEETLVILMASTDTNATAGCFTLLLLAQHPDVQDKLFKEIYKIYGDSGKEIIHNDITQFTYLDVVLKESLRLYPPTPIIMRKCERDVALPSGLDLSKNCNVVINIWGMHRNPRYWGADADKFKPERFLSATPEQLSAFMPFSHGSRNCIGYRYAMQSLKVSLVSILRRYRIKLASCYSHDQEFRVKFGIMMKDINHFKVQLEHRF